MLGGGWLHRGFLATIFYHFGVNCWLWQVLAVGAAPIKDKR
ncbi:hypothetical protein MOSL_0499 [Moraxella osloensis]|nr:hypothetical protein MOSL_0499 [Moraxella osloensis]